MESRVPDRDILLSKTIRNALDEIVGVSGQPRHAVLESMLRPVVEELSPTPDEWGAAVALVSIYLDDRKQVQIPDRLRMASFLLHELLRDNPSGRVSFFRDLKEWSAVQALCTFVPELDLGAEEAVTLFRTVDGLTENVANRGDAMHPLGQWATSHTVTARQMVEAWLGNEAWAGGLPSSSVQLLVESVVKGDEGGVVWRDLVIERLVQTNDEDQWALAAILACFAWPENGPAVEVRHQALLDHVGRLPFLLIDVGLRAIVRDARQHPVQSIATATRLLSIVSSRPWDLGQRQARANALAKLGWQALIGGRDRDHVLPALQGLLVPMLDGGPTSSSLDMFIGELSIWDVTMAEWAAAEWLCRHVEDLSTRSVGLDEIFPMFAYGLGAERVGIWLLRSMVDRRPELRLAAATLISQKGSFSIPTSALEALSGRQAAGLVHELVGLGLPGSVYIPLLMRLAHVRGDVRALVQETLIEDAIVDYPAALRKELARADLTSEASERPLAALSEELTRCFERRSEDRGRQKAVPELWMSSPSRRPWLLLEGRMEQEAFHAERKSGRHLFLDLVAYVPIVRGEGTRSSPLASATPFVEVSTDMEYSMLTRIDRVAQMMRRYAHRNRAETLFAEGGDTP
jgi:hypothetical protein